MGTVQSRRVYRENAIGGKAIDVLYDNCLARMHTCTLLSASLLYIDHSNFLQTSTTTSAERSEFLLLSNVSVV